MEDMSLDPLSGGRIPEVANAINETGLHAMVVVDSDRCTGCGACVRICHERCIALEDSVVTIDL